MSTQVTTRNVLEVSGAEFHDRPLQRLLAEVALSHCANDTAFLDYFCGSRPAHGKLVPIDGVFVDTLVLVLGDGVPALATTGSTGLPGSVGASDSLSDTRSITVI